MTKAEPARRKIVVCMDTPGWGGAEYDLGRLMAAGAFRPDMLLISPFADSRLLDLADRFKLNLIRHHSTNRLSGLARGLVSAARLKVTHPDTIWIFWCHHLDSNRWLQFGFAMLGMDFILSERICANSREEFRDSRLSIPLKRFAASKSLAVVFCGYKQPALFERIFDVRPGIATTIPNSRDVGKIVGEVRARQAEALLLRAKHGFGATPVFFCSGRLAPEKNFKAAILAFQLYVEAGGKGHLVIAGEGPEKGNLLALINARNQGKIHLVGYQSDMILWLSVADVFILPSYGEGVSGALIEAMAAGLPCLASDITGNRELVHHQKTGLLFPADDHGQLARNMARVCTEAELVSPMGRAAHALVLEKYDISVELCRWRSLLSHTGSRNKAI